MPTTYTRRGVLKVFGALTVAAPIIVAARPSLVPLSPEPPAAATDESSTGVEIERGSARRTKLEIYLKARGVKPVLLARESGYSRQHLLRLRLGTMLPSATCAAALVVALRRITREEVTLRDLFGRRLVRRLAHEARAVISSLEPCEREELLAAFARRGRRGGRR